MTDLYSRPNEQAPQSDISASRVAGNAAPMSALSDPAANDPFAVTVDKAGLKRRSVHGSFVTVASQAAKMLILLASQVILARLLVPADFGLVAMVAPVIAFILVFNDIGLGQAIVQRPVLVQDQVSALFWVNLALSCALACLVALLAPLLAWAYGEPHVIGIMVVLGILIPISALGINPTALLSRRSGTSRRSDRQPEWLIFAASSILLPLRWYASVQPVFTQVSVRFAEAPPRGRPVRGRRVLSLVSHPQA
jgi:hypothetical protein